MHPIMTKKRTEDIIYYAFSHFPGEEVSHGFSTRFGGVSRGAYESMNLGINSGDRREHVLENYLRFAAVFGLSTRDLVLSDQTHGNQVRVVRREDRGKGIERKKDYSSIDALVTKEGGIGLITHHADCVPLFFYDPVNRAIGIAHGGWKGTLHTIGKKVVETMGEEYGTEPGQLLAGIGPSIGPCCYEIGEEVAVQFFEEDHQYRDFIQPLGSGKHLLDLWAINLHQLTEAGIRESEIGLANRCTKCNPREFYSHRAHGSPRGTLAGLIALP